MSGIGFFLQDDGGFDLAIADGILRSDESLETAVLLSLFTDRRITEEELPDLMTDKRGYWGDMVADVDGDKFGSKLWTLVRSKRTIETLRRGEDYCRQALQWMIDDGIASAVTVTASFDGAVSEGRWKIEIQIQKPTGGTSRYDVLWNQLKAKRG